MCGIAGVFDLRNEARDPDPAATALAMADALAHRGPDGRDSWGDRDAGVGFGHRRLAIIDLSSGGAQPIHSVAGRFVITYNGEVYNFQELRSELTAHGHSFLTTSDTEVMLAACMEWGPDEAVKRFVGMFSFALFDRLTETLRLVRDRLGVKPMYWTIADGTLLFGSELRALMAHPSFVKELDREAVDAVLRYSYVPAPATVFRNVYKLPPGSILTIERGGEPVVTQYWQLERLAEKRGTLQLGFDEAVERLDNLLRDAVRGRMIADVPVGAFLSGGTDSATVVAMMQAVSNQPARTVTIGFADAAYDEARHAREVATHLQTDHTEIPLEPKAALDLVGKVADWFDEPFADSSQLPTYLVSSMTRQHVKVALSGDGGDELFAGYPKYLWLDRIWSSIRPLPGPARAALAWAAQTMPERALRGFAAMLLEPGRAERNGEKTRRLAMALRSHSDDEAALALAAVGIGGDSLVLGAKGTLHPSLPRDAQGRLPDLISRMQLGDMATYLPDDILTKVDRCSMAVALEAREPLLDHRLVEFLWSLPPEIHRGGEGSKGLLRAVLARYVPRAMTDRPKRGFSVPLAEWLRGPLREWADELLSPAALRQEGLLDPARVERLWSRHLAGVEDNATGLWNILMVRAWAQRWLAAEAGCLPRPM